MNAIFIAKALDNCAQAGLSANETSKLEMENLDREQKLLNLIADLERFSQEKRFPSGLNIFEAAGLGRQEIRHSNFLAFLLRPQEAHGLGDAFLKRLLQKALENLAVEPPISLLSVTLADFSDALVFREWRNIDLVIESESNKLVFAIENKINSIESESQLSKYESTVKSAYPNHRVVFSYLTKDGDSPSRELWSPMSYSDVLDAVQGAKFRQSSNLTNEAKIVIDHYVSLIRRNIVPDQELVEQCRKLYAQHKDALDLIIRYGEVNSFASAADLFFKRHSDLKSLVVRSSAAVFLPASLFEIVPQFEDTNWWGQSRPLLFWFNFPPDSRLGIVIEVGPFSSDKFDRKLLVGDLLKYFNHEKKNATAKYTRVYSEYKKLTENQAGDPEEIQAVINQLYEAVQSRHLSSVTEISRRFFQK